MEKFEIYVLGCGSALPTLRHNPSAQLLNVRDKLFLIDCGEGTQLSLRRTRQKFTRLSHIFISHLHDDHLFGLIGLISTFALTGRVAPLFLHAPADLQSLLQPQLDYFCRDISFEVRFCPLPTTKEKTVIYEDKSLTVSCFSLIHRVPCWGFLFEEKGLLPHIRRDMIDFLEIPHYAIQSIKEGAGWTTADGEFYPHEALVTPSGQARSYAYCSDTAYHSQLPAFIHGVDLLYHEATFADEHSQRARETLHSTARQAATIAREAEAKSLLIGHFSSRYDDETPLLKEAQEVFPQTQLAKEGLYLQL